MLQELRGKARIRSEEQGPLVIDHSRIEMGHGHRRRANSGLPIDFRVVPVNNLRLVTTQPLPAYGKTAKAFGFRNARLLQKGQRATPCPEKNKFRIDRPLRSVFLVLNVNMPARIRAAIQSANSVGKINGDAVLLSEPVNQRPGQ